MIGSIHLHRFYSMLKSQININRFKVRKGEHLLQSDPIAVEEPLQISLSRGELQEIFSITLRTPGNDQNLAFGLLFSEGVITSAADIESFALERIKGEISINLLTAKLSASIDLDLKDNIRRHPSYSGCGLCGKTSLKALELKQSKPTKVIQSKIDHQIVKSLQQSLAKQPLFSQTGGSHVAALIYENNGILDINHSPFFEDVGRHNALDKLIGYELQKNDLGQTGILVLSGRIGFELVQKAVMAGFSVIIALGAPSNLAIQAANQFNMTLIGFAKDDSFNLYTAKI